MPRDWVAVFDTWARPISDTEAEKAERAERMIRTAIAASPALGQRSIRVFAQGSYRNDTNVRQDSDVDIAVCCTDVVIADYSLAPGLSDTAVGLHDSVYTHQQFKSEVGAALIAHFGAAGVTRGNKAFDVHANTVRLDADVVPCLEHRLYQVRPDGVAYFRTGTNIRADDGRRIVNYPEQHFERGRAKNVATELAFKRVVRILKRLRNEMQASDVAAARPIPSFLVECLAWNSPDALFAHATFYEDVRAILLYLYGQLGDMALVQQWCEVNDIKYLFRHAQPWTREQALAFVLAAWQHVGFD